MGGLCYARCGEGMSGGRLEEEDRVKILSRFSKLFDLFQRSVFV